MICPACENDMIKYEKNRFWKCVYCGFMRVVDLTKPYIKQVNPKTGNMGGSDKIDYSKKLSGKQ